MTHGVASTVSMSLAGIMVVNGRFLPFLASNLKILRCESAVTAWFPALASKLTESQMNGGCAGHSYLSAHALC